MYRLLIVDDEPIIVEGLYECFQQQNDMPLEVHKAFNAEEALAVASRARVDVLLSDIEMPGMNGLLLQEAVSRLWPRCKTIFLTGYSDFQYIQSSLRNGAMDYILKREEDKKIIQSVNKAIEAIIAENSLDQTLHDARIHRTQALPILCKEYLLDLVHGEASTSETRSSSFADLEIPLRADEDVHLCMGRIDEWREDIGPGDKSLFMYSINNVVAEYFSIDFDMVFVVYAQDRFLWLMQPRKNGQGRLALEGMHSFNADGGQGNAEAASPLSNYIIGTIESAQTACKTFLKLPCSFIAGCEPCKWEHISAKFDRLTFQLARGLGLGREILLSDGHRFTAPTVERHLKENEVGLLSQPLERKDRATFYSKFDELSASVQEKDNLRSGTALELFYALSSMFIMFLNRRGLLEEMSTKVNMNKLLSIQEHASWDEAAQFFRALAEALFDWADVESRQVSTDVVGRVNEYIQEHIGGDLSLIRLAEIVHLTPFYLSRLYKQQTGQSLTDYIMEEKLLKAKSLLIDSSKKIYQIGLELGFESAPYFNRLFKRMTNMTPQDFREAWGKIEKST